MSEREQLRELCVRLGSPPAQAEAMAAQLLKRADQLAAERGIARTEAMKYLIELVVRGRNGEAPPQLPGAAPGLR